MAIQAPQNTPFFGDVEPETCLRICDAAMVDWLKTMKFRQQLPTVVTAWLSKQFAQHHETQDGTPVKQATSYPVLSLMMTGIVPAIDRRVVANIAALGPGDASTSNRMYVTPDQNEIYVLPFPLPFDLSYQVDIFTKTQQDMQLLRTAILGRMSFTDMVYLEANFPGYGVKLLPLTLSNLNDTSDLETGEEERELRNTLTFTMQAWIFRVPIRKKTIKKASVVIIDASTPKADNLVDGSEFLAWYVDNSHYNFDGNGFVTSVTESPNFSPPNRVIAIYRYTGTSLTGVGP